MTGRYRSRRSLMLVEHTDLPCFSQQDTCNRRKLRQQIKNPSVELSDDEDSDSIAPVQIMGLELLQTTAKLGLTSGNNVEEDDYSYDSYANDSIGSLNANGQNQDDPAAIPTELHRGLTAATPITTNVSSLTVPLNSSSSSSQHQQQQFVIPASSQGHRPFKRRMSNCSSIGENVEEHPQATIYWNNVDINASNNQINNTNHTVNNDYSDSHMDVSKDAYGYGDQSPVKRRQNVAERVDFSRFKSTRRGSLESCAENEQDSVTSVDYGKYKSTAKTTRRSSLGSYAGDSVDYQRYKSTKARRSSIGSYADDSVDYGRYKSTRTAQARRGSMESYAGDSVDYGRYKSTKTARRGSMESYAGDSVDYGKYKSTQTRRSSLGSYAGDSVDYGRYKSTQNRRSSLGSYAGDSVDYGKYKSTQTRRSSLGSYAGDSVDYGKYKSTKTARRGSMESYAGDSVDYGKYKSTQTRRSSLGSYAGDSVDYGKYKSTKTARRGSMESYAGDSVDYGRYKSTAPRRSSVGSYANDSFEGGRYNSHKNDNVPTARRDSGFGIARRGSMESFADDSSADYGYSKRRGSLESVEYGRYKNPARRGSLESVEYGRYKNPNRRVSIDSVDLLRSKSTHNKAAESAPAPSAGALFKPPATGSTDAGFLIKPPRRASLAGNAPHMLLKNEPALIKPPIRASLTGAGAAPHMLSKNESPAARNPSFGTQRQQSMAEGSSSHTAGKADFRNYKSTMTRRASLGSGTAGYQGSITPMGSQSTHVNSQVLQAKKGSGLSRPQQQQQQRPQRRFSNMSDYATDSIADVIVESGGIKRVLGHSSHNTTKRRFSTNSCCPSQESGEASVCSFSSRAA
jgi:hypothetical protein